MSSFEDDLPEIKREVTQQVIFHINCEPWLYKSFVRARARGTSHELKVDNVAQLCYDWAEAHNNEFGDIFQAELDFVDWDVVLKMV